MVGRLRETKNFDLVIDKLKGSNFNLHIYGKGEMIKISLRNLAYKNKVDLNIVDNIPNNDLIKVWKIFNFLMPSIFE